jgi:hypothetical protein
MSTPVMAASQRGSPTHRVWLPWMIGWLGGAVLGVTNGAARQLYADQVGQTQAHQISTVTLLGLLSVYIAVLDHRWPLPTRQTALAVGGSWLVFTVLFEFGLGHFVAGDSWSKLLEQYDVTRGNVWILVPLWMALGPAVMRELRTRNGS